MTAGLLAALWVVTAAAAAGAPLQARHLGVVVNESDPVSVAISEYYVQRRGVPRANLARIRLPSRPGLSRRDFETARALLEAQLPAGIEALLLTWAQPYRVECMSITAAFAMGYREDACARCEPTPFNPYFNSDGHRPRSESGHRIAMTLGARNVEEGRKLIDRGIAADGSAPRGTAYLLDTSDRARNVRARSFGSAGAIAGDRFQVKIIRADYIADRKDVMFYFTGMAEVPRLESNVFLPGSIADHLTSTGGRLTDSDQMSSLKWIAAGATGSYGAVVEPCNVTAKFPSIPILLKHYLAGDTLIEAYWKSVAMPAQGIFVGEPLARPFGPRVAGAAARNAVPASGS